MKWPVAPMPALLTSTSSPPSLACADLNHGLAIGGTRDVRMNDGQGMPGLVGFAGQLLEQFLRSRSRQHLRLLGRRTQRQRPADALRSAGDQNS